MNIEGVPDSIDWTKVRDFLVDLGIDPANVMARDKPPGISIGYSSISCTVRALNHDGLPYVEPATSNMAVHRISIPIVRDSDQD